MGSMSNAYIAGSDTVGTRLVAMATQRSRPMLGLRAQTERLIMVARRLLRAVLDEGTILSVAGIGAQMVGQALGALDDEATVVRGEPGQDLSKG